MIIRQAHRNDIPTLVDIYSYYVQETAVTFEYEAPNQEEFEERLAKIQAFYPFLVAEEEGNVLGYAYASTFRPRPAYDWSAEVTIYLDKSTRGRGIGKALYGKLEESLKAMGILNLNACIASVDREDSYLTKASPLFHEKCGFQVVGKFTNSGYKFNRWYDMIWMEKIIGQHVESVEPVIPFSEIVQTVL